MKNLYIDFDGVILDTITVASDMVDKAKIPFEDSDQIRNFYANLDWKNLLETTSVINEAIECIHKLIDSNKYDVSILTHVISLNEAIQKVYYIRQYFNDITIILVPKEISKTMMVHTKDSILVDDYIKNLQEWESEGGIAIRFSRKLNEKGFKVIDRLDKLLEMEL